MVVWIRFLTRAMTTATDITSGTAAARRLRTAVTKTAPKLQTALATCAICGLAVIEKSAATVDARRSVRATTRSVPDLPAKVRVKSPRTPAKPKGDGEVECRRTSTQQSLTSLPELRTPAYNPSTITTTVGDGGAQGDTSSFLTRRTRVAISAKSLTE